MKGRDKIERCLEAKRALDAIKQAIADEGETPERLRRRHEATIEYKLSYSKLSGGELGRMRRMEAERGNKQEPA